MERRLRAFIKGPWAPLTFIVLLVVPRLALGHSIDQEAQALFDRWTEAYGVEDPNPPQSIDLPLAYRAPHMLDCNARTAEQEAAEARGQRGDPPPWANTKRCKGTCSPPVPWIRGEDSENLPKTRIAQRDLWLSQFPPGDCSNRRILAVSWPPMKGFGLGAQLHVMSAAFSLARTHNRTLVPLPGTFARAKHKGCEELGQSGTLSCYFFPIASASCEQALAEALRKKQAAQADKRTLAEYLASDTQVVVLTAKNTDKALAVVGFIADAADHWGSPWLLDPQSSSSWMLGRHKRNIDPEKLLKVGWWRSQSIRFMLRAPTTYMCHHVNRIRHHAYGSSVARRVAHSLGEQAAIEGELEAASKGSAAVSELLRMKGQAAGDLRFLLSAKAAKAPFEEEQHREAYIPRPILAMHVRQGDKAKEMELRSFPAFMWLANRLRLGLPQLNHIWISTEMQSVINQTKMYPSWQFLYTHNVRQGAGTSIMDYEKQAGLEMIVATSFANLLIAGECDLFVSTLGSNWNRLIDELRLTNGRVHARLVALNTGQW